MSDAEKKPYNDKADASKALVEKQKAELAKKGYYTLSDGSKSTDPQNSDLLKVKKAKRSVGKRSAAAAQESSSEEKASPVKPAKKPKKAVAAQEAPATKKGRK